MPHRALAVLVALTLATLVAPLTAEAQVLTRMPRVGVLVPGSPAAFSTRVEAFRQGLRELGHVEDQTVVVEYRFAEGKLDQLSDLAADLVRRRVDVMVAGGGGGVARAARQATATIPIVMTNVADPIGERFIASLARPGGNMTGLTSVSQALTEKRLQLLGEAVPSVSRVAVLWNPDDAAKVNEFREAQDLAQARQVQVLSLEVRSSHDFERAFDTAVRRRTEALFTLSDAVTNTHRPQIAALAAKSRLPGMYPEREFAEAGGLLAYGPNYADLFRRAATYVDKILKGAKPGDLPVEQPMQFELVINLKTAEALGLTIPPTVLFQATEIIR